MILKPLTATLRKQYAAFGGLSQDALALRASNSVNRITLEESKDVAILLERGMHAHLALHIAPIKNFQAAMSIVLEDDAICDLVSIINAPSTVECTIQQSGTIGKKSHLHWYNATLSGQRIRQSLRSEATGSDATSSVDWIFFARGSERHELSVRNVFNGKNGRGEITMKGVAEEKAHVSAKGMIEIGAKGNGTDTYLTQNVLMLDPSSKVDAIPALEIKTNDVKASHSATVSRVTPEDLFYFAARGIEPREARRMYILGFLGELTERMKDVESRKLVLKMIEEKFSQEL